MRDVELARLQHLRAYTLLDRVGDLLRIAAGSGLDPEDLRRALDECHYDALLDR